MGLESKFRAAKDSMLINEEIKVFFSSDESTQRLMLAAILGQRQEACEIAEKIAKENYQLKAEKLGPRKPC